MKTTVIPIIKITLFKAPDQDIVFIFTGLKSPLGDYIQFQIGCPKGDGEKWIFLSLHTTEFEVVYDGFEVCAPV
jgi:hypothetical protein